MCSDIEKGVMTARRCRIAFIWPNDGLNDDEYWAYLPEDVAWLTTRYPGTLEGHDLDKATFEASADLGPILAAAKLLRTVKPHVAALGDHAGSFIKGKGHDIEQATAIAAATGAAHGTTPSTAMVAALRHLGAYRLAVTSPYDAEVTAAGVAFLAAHGFEIVAVERVTFANEHGIAGAGADVWRDAALRADRLEADAIALLGGGIRTAGMLPELERLTGKPAVPATAALVWHASRLAGVEPVKYGMGRLFAPPPMPGLTPQLHTSLRKHLSTATKSFAVSDAPPIFVAGDGAWLTDTDGKRTLDFACGSGTTVLGHNHPAVMAAIRRELDRGITHLGPHFHAPVQIALMARLAGVLPPALSVFHPATNGTEAMEAALKAAMHATGRRRFIAFEGSYHGRTLGSLAVSHARGGNAVLGDLRPLAVHLPYPEDTAALAELMSRLAAELASGDVAAVIVEPFQATAGMRVPHEGLLPALRAATERAGSLLVVDEVFTGYARSGRLFGFEWSGVVPDLVVLAKAASGGVPGGIVAGRPDILKTWKPGVQSSTFQLHPLSAAASLAVLDELVSKDYAVRALEIERLLRAAIDAAALPTPPFGGISGKGAMLGIAIVDADGRPDQPRTRASRAAALANGLITWECGTHGHVIGLVPPLVVTKAEIDRAIAILAAAIKQAR